MNTRLISIIRKEFIQLGARQTHAGADPGYAAGAAVPAGVCRHQRCAQCARWRFLTRIDSPEGRALLDAYRAADYFSLAYSVGSEAELRSLIEKGQVGVGMIIPPDYADRLQRGPAQVAFIVDGSDPSVATTALSAAQLIGQSHATGSWRAKIARSGINLSTAPPVEVRTNVWYNPDMVTSLFHDPRGDRDDPVRHHRHPDRHRGGARA